MLKNNDSQFAYLASVCFFTAIALWIVLFIMWKVDWYGIRFAIAFTTLAIVFSLVANLKKDLVFIDFKKTNSLIAGAAIMFAVWVLIISFVKLEMTGKEFRVILITIILFVVFKFILKGRK